MANDLLSTLRIYLSKVADGEHTPAELATSLNTWVRESTESIKIKVEEEVKKSVSKMGFIKRTEFEALKKEVAALREIQAASTTATKKPKPSAKPKTEPVAKAKKVTAKITPSAKRKVSAKPAVSKSKTSKGSKG